LAGFSFVFHKALRHNELVIGKNGEA
jgi:hypothetical protein